MPKRFKFRLSSVIPSFRSCRSKDPSYLPSHPLPSFLRFSSLNRRLRHTPPSSDYNWRKDTNWHVVDGHSNTTVPRCKIYNSSAHSSSDDTPSFFPPPLPPLSAAAKGKQRRPRRKKTSMSMLSSGVRLSVSSADSCLFSEEEGEEMETLVSNSSRSFSTDSSTDFSPHLETIREGPTMFRRKKRHSAKRTYPKRSVLHNRNIIVQNRKKTSGCPSEERSSDGGGRWSSAGEDGEVVPARLSAVFQRLMPCAVVEGKVRESFAVVKRSEDPYEDFKRSMVEMIVEKEMVEERDLKELLRCFLSLNSEQHHGIILGAFNEIWDALFSKAALPAAC